MFYFLLFLKVFKADNPTTNDSYAVVGARFEPATNDRLLKSVDTNLIHVLNPSNYNKELELNLHDLFEGVINKPGQKFFHYKGSLTTPPCSEIVNWYLSENTFYMKEEDYKPFYEIFFANEFSHNKGNFRLTQALHGRSPCFVKIPDGKIANLYLWAEKLKKGIISLLLLYLTFFLIH